MLFFGNRYPHQDVWKAAMSKGKNLRAIHLHDILAAHTP